MADIMTRITTKARRTPSMVRIILLSGKKKRILLKEKHVGISLSICPAGRIAAEVIGHYKRHNSDDSTRDGERLRSCSSDVGVKLRPSLSKV